MVIEVLLRAKVLQGCSQLLASAAAAVTAPGQGAPHVRRQSLTRKCDEEAQALDDALGSTYCVLPPLASLWGSLQPDSPAPLTGQRASSTTTPGRDGSVGQAGAVEQGDEMQMEKKEQEVGLQGPGAAPGTGGQVVQPAGLQQQLIAALYDSSLLEHVARGVLVQAGYLQRMQQAGRQHSQAYGQLYNGLSASCGFFAAQYSELLSLQGGHGTSSLGTAASPKRGCDGAPVQAHGGDASSPTTHQQQASTRTPPLAASGQDVGAAHMPLLERVLSGPCARHLVLCQRLRTLCALDGGGDYGLPEEAGLQGLPPCVIPDDEEEEEQHSRHVRLAAGPLQNLVAVLAMRRGEPGAEAEVQPPGRGTRLQLTLRVAHAAGGAKAGASGSGSGSGSGGSGSSPHYVLDQPEAAFISVLALNMAWRHMPPPPPAGGTARADRRWAALRRWAAAAEQVARSGVVTGAHCHPLVPDRLGLLLGLHPSVVGPLQPQGAWVAVKMCDFIDAEQHTDKPQRLHPTHLLHLMQLKSWHARWLQLLLYQEVSRASIWALLGRIAAWWVLPAILWLCCIQACRCLQLYHVTFTPGKHVAPFLSTIQLPDLPALASGGHLLRASEVLVSQVARAVGDQARGNQSTPAGGAQLSMAAGSALRALIGQRSPDIRSCLLRGLLLQPGEDEQPGAGQAQGGATGAAGQGGGCSRAAASLVVALGKLLRRCAGALVGAIGRCSDSTAGDEGGDTLALGALLCGVLLTCPCCDTPVHLDARTLSDAKEDGAAPRGRLTEDGDQLGCGWKARRRVWVCSYATWQWLPALAGVARRAAAEGLVNQDSHMVWKACLVWVRRLCLACCRQPGVAGAGLEATEGQGGSDDSGTAVAKGGGAQTAPAAAAGRGCSGGGCGAQGGGWREFLLRDAGVVGLLGAALSGVVPELLESEEEGYQWLLAEVAEACVLAAAAFPIEVAQYAWGPQGGVADGSGDGSSGSVWSPKVLAEVAGVVGGEQEGQPLAGALRALEEWGGECGRAGGPVGPSAGQRQLLEQAVADTVHNAHVGKWFQHDAALLPPLCELRALLRVCCNPRCVALPPPGQTEAEAEAGGGRGAGVGPRSAAWYCCARCRKQHGKAGRGQAQQG